MIHVILVHDCALLRCVTTTNITIDHEVRHDFMLHFAFSDCSFLREIVGNSYYTTNLPGPRQIYE